jgi:hypothetical protein
VNRRETLIVEVEANEDLGRHPARPRLALNVGITGHRASNLPAGALDALRPAVDKVFRDLREAAMHLYAASDDLFSTEPPILRLHTPLATGADQLAADSARASGYTVRALLPFAPDVYRADFAEGAERDEFSDQLERADAFFALPCDRSDGDGAYVQIGKAVIAASDILVAIWDGGNANGPGGTGHVVELALRAGVPVIHIEIEMPSAQVMHPRLLDGLDMLDGNALPLATPEDYYALLRGTLAPHTSIERAHIAQFYGEREKRTNLRIEYPLLLALLGVKKLPRGSWRQSAIIDDVRQDWSNVHGVYPRDAKWPLARSYGWANFLAIRYAQLFRSGHVTNYFLSTFAVILALFGLIAPGAKLYLVLAELGTIALLFYNTQSGTRGEWHRRWLQYRHLAESLRPLIYLKQTGLISTPFRSDIVRGPMNREAGADWTRWYAAAIWRQMDSPHGVTSLSTIRSLANDVLDEQVTLQAAYHHVNAERMHKLDHRLHEVGNFLMGAVIAACVLYVGGYVLMHSTMKSLAPIFIFVTAGFPAIGAAVFGMRGHGEHLLAASRSAKTAQALLLNAARLKRVNRQDLLAAELETTAAIMLADLNEWTMAYSERALEIPA